MRAKKTIAIKVASWSRSDEDADGHACPGGLRQGDVMHWPEGGEKSDGEVPALLRCPRKQLEVTQVTRVAAA